MNFINYVEQELKQRVKDNGIKAIAFMEGNSKRMQMAASQLNGMKRIKPILIFETPKQKEESNISNDLDSIVIGEDKKLFEELVDAYTEKRKGKETKEQAQELLKKNTYFSAMLVETGKVDGAIGGVHNPTSEVLKAAFKGIGSVEGIKTISSIMIMHRQSEWFIFTDISVNVNPNKEQLVEIAKNAYDFGDYISFKKKIAFLSFSTAGSAINEYSEKMRDAALEFNDKFKPTYKSIGEVQFDAAFDLQIRESKYKYDDGFKKMPTIFVFPDLNSGNIGYKIAQRMGAWGAIGPIVTGLKKPINDLSRGSTIEDIKYTGIITALQCYPPKKAHE